MGLKPARGYNPRDAAACHTRPVEKPHGPRPGGPVQRGKWPVARRQGVRAGRAHDVVTARSPRVRRHGGTLTGGTAAASRWQGVSEKH
jgi:hypothetical protein